MSEWRAAFIPPGCPPTSLLEGGFTLVSQTVISSFDVDTLFGSFCLFLSFHSFPSTSARL
jgi:hypothetical protein